MKTPNKVVITATQSIFCGAAATAYASLENFPIASWD